eukprot:RCo019889
MSIPRGAFGTQLVRTPATIRNAELIYDRLTQLGLKYPLHPFEALMRSDKPTGLVPPLRPLQPLPFYVERTNMDNLPVYLQRVRKSSVGTRVKRLHGDIVEFSMELRKVTEKEPYIRSTSVMVSGVLVDNITIWLFALGF